jgi:DNA primase large subunit
MSDKWRRWFVRCEEILLRARVQAVQGRGTTSEVLVLNGLPCEQVQKSDLTPKMLLYFEYYKSRHVDEKCTFSDFYFAPLGISTRLVKERNAFVSNGRVVLHSMQVQEVFFAVFKVSLHRGLHDAFLMRTKLDHDSEDERSTMMAMLDGFLTRFVSEPIEQLESSGGSITPAEVPFAASTHFPLCMRRADSHLRAEGHLKHHGRLMYGLFLKSIGLSMDDALTLFSSLMTIKGGGSREAFAKTAYGYNIRHNYGKEGKKTSYSSLSCGTIMTLPPNVDRFDCHGCPFRFRDENALRKELTKDQPSAVPGGSKVRPSPADVEDIVKDAKEQHYTRACYKYFVATHPEAKRDTLFRSPFEYYTTSLSYAKERERELSEAKGKGLEGRPKRALSSKEEGTPALTKLKKE